jgi:hypothetical protein
MTCGTLVANQLGITNLYSKGGHFLCYIGQGYNTPSETSILHLRGL